MWQELLMLGPLLQVNDELPDAVFAVVAIADERQVKERSRSHSHYVDVKLDTAASSRPPALLTCEYKAWLNADRDRGDYTAKS